MNSKDFVKGVYEIKEEIVGSYFDPLNETFVGELIKSLDLNSTQLEVLKSIVDGTLTDGFYTLLVGIEGGASIGNNIQQQFKLFDEKNNSLIENIGELAFEYFQES